MYIDVYDGMGEIILSGKGEILSRMSSGNLDWDSVTVQFANGHKVEGYLPKEKTSQQ